MRLEIGKNGLWYHGSDKIFSVLNAESTITQWKSLAEAFSHKPSQLSYGDDGIISHNGTAKGRLYIIDECLDIENDIIQHPNSSMDQGAEFVTKRPLKVKLIQEL